MDVDQILDSQDDGESICEWREKQREADRADALRAELDRLARLPGLEYEQRRRDVAKQLGVRAGVLDEEVRKARPGQSESKSSEPEWKPPVDIHAEPVAAAALLDDLIAAIRRFVFVDSRDALTVALWTLFTWAFEAVAETNPYLHIQSPTPACGKSTLLKVLKMLSRDGWLLSRLSPSAFARTLGREKRTLLLDEGDAFLHDNESMRNLLDGASDPDTATISFSVKTGDDWNPVELNCFVPIAIASIGPLRNMQTVESRCIATHLKRATPRELKGLAKGRRRELKAALQPLAARCARWAQDNADVLKEARPVLPDSLSGREQDKWEPLVSIADACGEDYGRQARAAAEAAAGSARDGESLGELLLVLCPVNKFTKALELAED